jgi:hypothetical protein
MQRRLARRLYVVLLRLHPGWFSRDFADEMLRVFDEAAETYGAGWLLCEAAISLGRQWVWRSADEGYVAAGSDRFGLMAGVYPVFRPPHLTMGKLSAAGLLSLLLYGLIRPL